MAIAGWRARLQPASYNGVPFHVDVGTRASGRRNALHEFPKKDIPYAEDMGRKARKFSITAYLIDTTQSAGGIDYVANRDALIDELERDDSPTGGILLLPTGMANSINVNVDSYSVTERRERGGTCEFEISFVETGQDISGLASTDTQAAVTMAADAATDTTSDNGFAAAAQANINSGSAGL